MKAGIHDMGNGRALSPMSGLAPEHPMEDICENCEKLDISSDSDAADREFSATLYRSHHV
jgi:hypothetical protein